jgi:hypothetical protein
MNHSTFTNKANEFSIFVSKSFENLNLIIVTMPTATINCAFLTYYFIFKTQASHKLRSGINLHLSAQFNSGEF